MSSHLSQLTAPEKVLWDYLSEKPISERSISQQCILQILKNSEEINNLKVGELRLGVNQSVVKDNRTQIVKFLNN